LSVSTARSSESTKVKEQLRDADAVCVVFALDNRESLEHVKTLWLPLVQSVIEERQQQQGAPVCE
jgi:hypothetical protein